LVYQKLVIQFTNDSNCTSMTLNKFPHLALFDSSGKISTFKARLGISLSSKQKIFIAHQSVNNTIHRNSHDKEAMKLWSRKYENGWAPKV
jgi:hypothetical protein